MPKQVFAADEAAIHRLFLIDVGIGITCISWIFLLFGIINIILANNLVVYEERFGLAKYGDVYQEYMNRTPRWIGIPKK